MVVGPVKKDGWMTRFEKLEFNDGQGEKPDTAPSAPKPARPLDVDWMAKAEEQRRAGLHENALKFYSRGLEQDRSQVAGWLGQVQMLVLLDECPEADSGPARRWNSFPPTATSWPAEPRLSAA